MIVNLCFIIEFLSFKNVEFKLIVVMGYRINNELLFMDIVKMLYVLIVGVIGLGKLVCINSILMFLLYKNYFEELRLLFIDLKMVELVFYNGLLYLVVLVIIDVKVVI